jgi:hypothetical protein
MSASRTARVWIAAAAAAAWLAAAQHGAKEHGVTPEKAGAMFKDRCANCHVAPDAAFATDRAWLGQVHDTA